MAPSGETRVRTFRWHDPAGLVEPARTMSGLELLRAIVAGTIDPPPISDLLDLRLVSIEPSSAVFEFEPTEYMYSPLGTVHGGIITVLLDSAMGCAFHTTLPAGVSYTTLEIKVNFVRPVTHRLGTMRAEARVVHSGDRVATAESKLVDRERNLYAHATSTLITVRPRAGVSEEPPK